MLATVLNAENSTFRTPKVFVLVSSCMTWAKTKRDAGDEETPLGEEDYRRRRAHPSFKTHLNAEKLVIKMGKDV